MVATLEIKSIDDKTGEFEGYASTFGNVDDGRDVVVKGAFVDSLKEHKADGTMPAMFYSHDVREPVGDWLDMREDDAGLYARGKLWLGEGIPKVQQTYRMMKGTGAKGLSIGYGVRGKDGSSIDGKSGVRSLKRLDLFETSPTPFPMNRKAKITSIKSSQELGLLLKKADGSLLTTRDFERALRDAGFSDQQAKTIIAVGYRALNPRDGDEEKLSSKLDEIGSFLK